MQKVEFVRCTDHSCSAKTDPQFFAAGTGGHVAARASGGASHSVSAGAAVPPTRSRQDWSALADGLSPRTLAFISGRPVPASDGRTRPTVSPASGKVLADVADCGPRDVDAAAAAARRAFDDGRWSRQAPAVRRRVLLALADLVERHRDELALLDSLDVGKLIADTTA